jgi:DNA repair protein RadC
MDAGYGGHRSRLLEKYIKSGIPALNDYEILELILTYAIPRKDTKPIAKTLLAHYGTVSAVLSAPLDELCNIGSLTRRSAAIITLIKDTLSYCLDESSMQKPIITHRSDIEKHLRLKFGHSREEYAAAVFLDGANQIIGTEIIAQGTANRCSISPRTIIDRALRCGAAAFILAHNHPAGTAAPSEGDWMTTEKLINAGKCVDIPLIDHVIISKDSVVSLREYDRWPL